MARRLHFQRAPDKLHHKRPGGRMSLDISTLYLVATLVAAHARRHAAVLRQAGEHPGAELVGHRLSARRRLGGALDARPARTLGETLSLALNAVGFVACGMVWNAARVFHGRKPNLAGAVARRDGLDRRRRDAAARIRAMRMTIGAGIVAIYAALTATELWSRAAQDDAAALAGDRGAGDARLRADAADPARRPAAPARRQPSPAASG